VRSLIPSPGDENCPLLDQRRAPRASRILEPKGEGFNGLNQTSRIENRGGFQLSAWGIVEVKKTLFLRQQRSHFQLQYGHDFLSWALAMGEGKRSLIYKDPSRRRRRKNMICLISEIRAP